MAGDSILIHLQCTLESGDIGVIIYNTEEATIKRIKWSEDHSELSLVPSNPEYMTKVIKKDDLTACRIYGKVVKVIRNF